MWTGNLSCFGVKHDTIYLEKRFKCALCSYSTDISTNMKHHAQTHSDIPICYSGLESNNDVIFDGANISTKSKYFPPKMFGCSRCPYITTRMDNLRRHELVHTGDRPFKCTLCSRSFTQNTHLKKHIRTHCF
ncbi:unnamed protein product [Larinioides sclopetarius]|uniref:C2H2-type domain-containing protein n=1 Tax=Larinioides sclopetarius TaxID=280406 RepID=A0AAV1ZTG6_9ARAC